MGDLEGGSQGLFEESARKKLETLVKTGSPLSNIWIRHFQIQVQCITLLGRTLTKANFYDHNSHFIVF